MSPRSRIGGHFQVILEVQILDLKLRDDQGGRLEHPTAVGRPLEYDQVPNTTSKAQEEEYRRPP